MNRTKAKEIAPIIQAYGDGASVQWKYREGKGWYDTDNPVFETSVEWRVMPSPQLRPYTRDELNALVGSIVIHKSTGTPLQIIGGAGDTEMSVHVASMGRYQADIFLKTYMQKNGDPCGVLE